MAGGNLTSIMLRFRLTLVAVCGGFLTGTAVAMPIETAGQPGVLNILVSGDHCLRITLKPASHAPEFPMTPLLFERGHPKPVISLSSLTEPVRAQAAGMGIEVLPDPLRVIVRGDDGSLIQSLTFQADGDISFPLDERPVLGMGEGGPATPEGIDWRTAAIQFDRKGSLDKMQPRWQSEAYGSRNPVALLVGTRGWALYFSTPWGQIDLSQPDRGKFITTKAVDPEKSRQTFKDQSRQLGKGLPPQDAFVPGLIDCFVFDARQPAHFMKDVSRVSGPAVMPPKWALGYMQSHRTLEDDGQMLGIVDTFRNKRIPIDAVIYLGTGFTPRGWNTPQPSFDFNPQVFKRDPVSVIADLHQRNVKVAVHIVPWDRERLPTLQGSIPPAAGETSDTSHISDYWKQHVPLVKAGVDAWWPDEGDWFDLFERVKRHQLYYEGPISTQPERRPWSLHRNGHLGVARYGGWIWSGDTESSWKTLEGQIAVGINHSLSVGPYWGSDIGGFYSNPELTGELYARWFQFAAFCPSFRAHGRTWWTRLPWGWGGDQLGPIEDKVPPLVSSLNNPAIEPIVRRYDELRYQLLSYNYTLAWQARETGMPFMRAMWLHYPGETEVAKLGNQYLWGRDLLIAPVFEKGATLREIRLPEGAWYDWWSGEKVSAGPTLRRSVDLATMPILVRAGAILPVDPIRQYTSEKTTDPLTIRIYQGADGDYTLYEDDGISQRYLGGDFTLTRFRWDDAAATLKIDSTKPSASRPLKIEVLPSGKLKTVEFNGEALTVGFKP